MGKISTFPFINIFIWGQKKESGHTQGCVKVKSP